MSMCMSLYMVTCVHVVCMYLSAWISVCCYVCHVACKCVHGFVYADMCACGTHVSVCMGFCVLICMHVRAQG